MPPFKDALTEPQIWQLVAYIRTQARDPEGRARSTCADPDGQVIKSEKQTFKIEVVARDIETPWGLAFLPDGRLLITERPGRLRIVEKGKLLPEAVKGTAEGLGEAGRRHARRRGPPAVRANGWIYLSYSETVPGYTPLRLPRRPLRAPAPPQGGAAAAGRRILRR